MSTPEQEEATSGIAKPRGNTSKPSKKLSPLILPATNTAHSSTSADQSPSLSSPNSPLRRSTAFYGKGKEKRRQSFLETTVTSVPTTTSPTKDPSQTSPRLNTPKKPQTLEGPSSSKVEYVEVLNEVSHPSRVPGFSNNLVDYFEIDPSLLKKKQPQPRLNTNKKKRTFSGTTVKAYPQVRSFSGGGAATRATNMFHNKQSGRSIFESEYPGGEEGTSTSAGIRSSVLSGAQPGIAAAMSDIPSDTPLLLSEEGKHKRQLPMNRPEAKVSRNHGLSAIETDSTHFGRPRTSIVTSQDEAPPFTPTFGPVPVNTDANDCRNSYRVSRYSNRSSLPRHPFRDTFGFDKQLLSPVDRASPLRNSMIAGGPSTADLELSTYPQRVSSLQNLHKELNKERLSLLGEISELKRISRYAEDGGGEEFIQKIQHAENRIGTFEHLIEQAQKSIQSSSELTPEVDRGKNFDRRAIHGNHRLVHPDQQSSSSSEPNDESMSVDMYIPYTIPETRISLPNYAYSRIQPLLLDDTPVFKSALYKLGSNRKWQKREFRIDGFMLVCLEKKKIKVEPKTVILAKYSTANGLQSDPGLRRHFYPTSPPLPHISHPLVATASSVEDNTGVDQYVDYYQPPKWVIPLSDILAVTLLARNGFKVRKCFAIHTAERKYILRAETEMETACWVYLLKRMAINRYHEINLLEYNPRSPSIQANSSVHVNPTNDKSAQHHDTKTGREVVLDQWRTTVNELVQREPSLRHSLHADTQLSLSPPRHRGPRNNLNTPSAAASHRSHISKENTSSASGSMQRRKPLPIPPMRPSSSPIINPLRIVNQSEA
ncbi:hypothetical protein K493DRAFT_314172 [Basidiobolus meristosporus CBS 931.73]|uniref:PH domain-containing protein n=1 Tax=Basidiobolus meristosporus CBS 931.73 TaxID=1314790 RepID=A0A1Y1YGX1_9FUNG|nr:hypothetical protein K493DRAFT_314172 [Basidiobolus meristosporus CBS 931.73]|eukprot:ORX97198.1 hypothetical protein K493DRAFT_314172 [Basidiobolus meristosporus CBS 931.73]